MKASRTPADTRKALVSGADEVRVLLSLCDQAPEVLLAGHRAGDDDSTTHDFRPVRKALELAINAAFGPGSDAADREGFLQAISVYLVRAVKGLAGPVDDGFPEEALAAYAAAASGAPLPRPAEPGRSTAATAPATRRRLVELVDGADRAGYLLSLLLWIEGARDVLGRLECAAETYADLDARLQALNIPRCHPWDEPESYGLIELQCEVRRFVRSVGEQAASHAWPDQEASHGVDGALRTAWT